jgi:phenylpropionate dioxygenase-like ring-hydroxylating dioxygenase large terminal subunit
VVSKVDVRRTKRAAGPELISSSYGEGPYHQCWYPIARTDELEEGGLLGRDVLDGRVILTRDESGAPHVFSAYCAHMGADLSLGEIVDGQVRCPFHHWEYGPEGVCTRIATGDRIPGAARLFAFPTEEKWDLIWIFNGPKPLYPVPTFPNWDRSTMVYRTFELQFEEKLFCDPWFFGSNAFDFQHLRSLHGLTFEADAVRAEPYAMGYHSEDDTPGAGHWSMDLMLWGTNAVVVMADNDGNPAHHIAAGTPCGESGTRYFFVAATTVDRDDPGSVKQAEAVLDVIETVNTAVVNEDVPVLNTIANTKRHLVKSDKALSQYLRYAQEYPTSSFDELQLMATKR